MRDPKNKTKDKTAPARTPDQPPPPPPNTAPTHAAADPNQPPTHKCKCNNRHACKHVCCKRGQPPPQDKDQAAIELAARKRQQTERFRNYPWTAAQEALDDNLANSTATESFPTCEDDHVADYFEKTNAAPTGTYDLPPDEMLGPRTATAHVWAPIT
eukprot:PhF_6_TR8299/c1_g1_i2/m.12788